MRVRDRYQPLPRCLRSLRGLVDRTCVAAPRQLTTVRGIATLEGADCVDAERPHDVLSQLTEPHGWCLVVRVDERVHDNGRLRRALEAVPAGVRRASVAVTTDLATDDVLQVAAETEVRLVRLPVDSPWLGAALDGERPPAPPVPMTIVRPPSTSLEAWALERLRPLRGRTARRHEERAAWYLGLVLEQRRDYTNARRCFKAASAATTGLERFERAHALARLARIELTSGTMKAAQAAIAQAVRLCPTDVFCRFVQGRVSLAGGAYGLALATAQRLTRSKVACRVLREHAVACLRAEALLASGRQAEAVRCLLEAAEQAPDAADVRECMDRALA